MSEEPLYCTICGKEWGDCAHALPGDPDHVMGLTYSEFQAAHATDPIMREYWLRLARGGKP
jgi:hypothetical protein